MRFQYLAFLTLLFSYNILSAALPAPQPAQKVSAPAPQPAWSGVESVVIRSMNDTDDDFSEEEELEAAAPEHQSAPAPITAPPAEEEELEEASPEEVATFLAALQDVFGSFADEE